MGGRGVCSLTWPKNGSVRRAFFVISLVLLGAAFEARSEGRPAAPSADGKCPVAADTQRWTKQEIFVWDRVCSGAIANFNEGTAYGGNLDPDRPEGLPESRILSRKFLETILLEDKYRSALPRRGVRIIGARFTERIDLVNAELKHELWLNRCLLEQGVDVSGATSTHLLGFDGSKVAGAFTMDGSRIEDDVFMRNARFAGITMAGTHIRGALELNGSTVTGELNLDHLTVDSSLLIAKAKLEKVVLVIAHIGGVLGLDGATVTGKLDMDMLRVGSSLFMRHGQFSEVVFRSARVGGTLELNGSTVTGEFDMDMLRVDSSLFLRNDAKFADVKLTAAHIGGQLDMTDSKVAGNLECYSLVVDQDGLLYDAQFTGTIDCKFSKFRNLYLNNSTFGGDVDLSSGQFSELRLGEAVPQHSLQWSPGKALILRNARAETIPLLTDAWPAHVDVNGFTYRALRHDTAVNRHRTPECPSDLFRCWFGKQKSFSPHAYEQLALAFQNQGHADDARAIRYDGRERERSESGGLRYAWLSTLNWAIGYGHHIELAMIWTFLLVILGAFVLAVSGEGPKNGMPVGLSYSFDMLLPIIKLRDAHYEIDLVGWPRYYFYVHKIAGYVLATFLIAGISGLTK